MALIDFGDIPTADVLVRRVELVPSQPVVDLSPRMDFPPRVKLLP